VCAKENGHSFEFDFSTVYWNPRLSNEHSRIASRLSSSSVLFDACAGVGPFAVPAARAGASVFANDLNPESFRWLKVNCDKNKKVKKEVMCYNEDAREFIRTTVKTKLAQLWQDNGEGVKDVHITMNLPALAITFLDVFRGLFSDSKHLRDLPGDLLPKVHVYGFSKAEDKAKHIRERCEKYLGVNLDEQHLEEVAFVRNVAPNKDMMRASFLVPASVMFDLAIVKPGDIVEAEDEVTGDHSKKRDLSPDRAETNPKKISSTEPVWYGERL
jgi:tRNA (guanine37-N1)-methyltransferase